MIFSGKSIDLSSLILDKMKATIEKASTGIPYAQLLTRVFEGFKIDVKATTKLTVKDVFDERVLSQNNIQLENEQVTRIQIFPSTNSTHEIGEPSTPTVATGSELTPKGMMILKSLHTDSTIITRQITEINSEVKVLKADVQEIKAGYQVIKTAMKDFVVQIKVVTELLLKSTGTTSTTHSAVETDLGLDKLAQVAAKEVPDEEDKDGEDGTDKEGDGTGL